MSKITPFLWFDSNLNEVVRFYASIFKNHKVSDIMTLDNVSEGPTAEVTTASFELEGQKFMALNGGPMFKFTEAVSFFVNCTSQQEVDYYWEKLSEGGEPGRCGWLKDRYGLSWQIIPDNLGSLLGHKDPQKAKKAMATMLSMQKLDVAALEASVA